MIWPMADSNDRKLHAEHKARDRSPERTRHILKHLGAIHRRAQYRSFSIGCGGRSLYWELDRSTRKQVPVRFGDTEIVVRTAEDEGELAIGTPVAIHLLHRDESGMPETGLPAKCQLGRGRFLVFHPPTLMQEANSCSIEIEYRESLYRRLTSQAAASLGLFWQAFKPTPDAGRAPAGPIRFDFCLADLRPQELHHAAALPALLFAFVLLPSLVASVVALVLSIAGVSSSAVLFGGLAGALVAFTGTIVCSASVSVVAASLGGIPVSLVLGITSALLLESKGGVRQAGELLSGAAPVLPGLGGLLALVRPTGISVALVATAVGLLSLAMGWVRSTAGQRWNGAWTATSVAKAIGIGIIGAMGPGLVYGISSLGEHGRMAELAFGLGLAVVGGVAFGAAAGIRSGKTRRGVYFGLFYLALTLILILLGFRLESSFWRLLLATTTNHILLQGTFFAFTYVIAEKAGGPRSGVIASVVEGVPPYCIFILTRPWT